MCIRRTAQAQPKHAGAGPACGSLSTDLTDHLLKPALMSPHPLVAQVRQPYNAQHERERKRGVEMLMQRSREQDEAENEVLAQAAQVRPCAGRPRVPQVTLCACCVLGEQDEVLAQAAQASCRLVGVGGRNEARYMRG